ncbi:MAG: hypothetical protein J6T84_07330 [Spirochaetaceae bacterium]|nr:hypothetical protein [Spirochaetaceae bacterium]
MNNSIIISGSENIKFNNNTDFCVGTGRMGLALTKEYFDQLKVVQNSIGFKFIRGHGLFCDDMGIYQVYYDKTGLKKPEDFSSFEEYKAYLEKNAKTSVEYNFTYLDRVIDSYLELNIRPFLELGFMPKKLASGTQTVFYWKGNVTPPINYDVWADLVANTLRHLLSRYGEQVLSWPVEIWNEPNLFVFWKDADMQEYFKLYECTAKAVKSVSKKFQVGGPAICGGADEKWMKGFLDFCSQKKPPLDFISRHHYTTETPEEKGHYGYAKLMTPDETFQTLEDCRKIIDSYPDYKNLPFYITEFNTSYIPNCPIHDTNLNAAYIARTLSKIGDYATAYSYWTFGDVFEEHGIPFTPFHGGFGLLANGGIPKPTFWTFKFFKDLELNAEKCVYRDKSAVIVKTTEGGYKGIIWNLPMETDGTPLEVSLKFQNLKGRICLITKTIDEKSTNPLKIWNDLGQPANPSQEQIELIKAGANPLTQTQILDDGAAFAITAAKNAVVYFELVSAPTTADNGYNYDFYDKMF